VLTSVAGFVDRLRAAMVPVSMVETLDAIAALGSVDLARRAEVKAALRTTLVKRSDHLQAFDALFDVYFAPRPTGSGSPPGPSPTPPAGGMPAADIRAHEQTSEPVPDPADVSAELLEALLSALARNDTAAIQGLVALAVERFAGISADRTASVRYYMYRVLRRLDLSNLLQRTAQNERDDGGEPSRLAARLRRDEHQRRFDELRRLIADAIRDRLVAVQGPSAAADAYHQVLIEDVDVLTASPAQLRAMRLAIQPLARMLATRIVQRRRVRRHGRLDVRRTMRRSLSAGGVPLEPAFRHRRVARPEIILLCDVSGSVAEFARFTIMLIYALHEEFSRIRSFLFVDGFAEVTAALTRGGPVLSPANLLAATSAVAVDGHSDYGAVFRRFWREHGQATVGPRTTVVITGDARGNYRDPGLEPLRQIRDRARRLYWLNPEPRSDWDTTDSLVRLYRPYCAGLVEARNLRQLAAFVRGLV
jgi:uncharacterized protein with von Willebrand factor type A (vWA) domain